MKKIKQGIAALLLICAVFCFGTVEAAENDWVWISSDSKYSKFYSPSQVQVVRSFDGVATTIDAWTKTTYSYEGAAETIANYGIGAVIPNPNNLSYSIALVEINPQNRTMEYVQEDFYNSKGQVIWSKVYNPRTTKEINSQQPFEEDFYTAIVDTVFRHGETERRLAQDRWIKLWENKQADGSYESCIADTTTMRQRGDNLILWVWQERKDTAGNVQEIKFMKKAVNLVQGSEKVVNAQYWSPSFGWKDMSGELDGMYYAIPLDGPEANGLKRLRAYSAGYQFWLTRYSLKKK